MKKIELLGVDQDVYFETLDCGLKVFLIPFSNKKNYYVNYVTKYGSINLEYVPLNEKKIIKTNPGVAHFLEHKMFEQENGIDPFNFFSESGTSCNASTTYKKTSYFINGVNDLEKNLNYLINFVNSPYFTDKNVEKEKGIIIEEMNMYKDDPDWILSDEIQKSTFKYHPVRLDIAGYPDTVKSITKEELYKCYNTFYQPNNMYLVVGGDINLSKVIDLIKSNNKLISKNGKLINVNNNMEEPIEINEKYKEITCSYVSVPKLAMNIKLSIKDVKNKYKYYLYINAILRILFGTSSDFNEEMLSKKYASSIYFDKMLVDDYLILEFFAESEKPKELIKNIIDQFKNKVITEQELERFKKVQIAYEVMMSDKLELTVDNIISDLITWDNIINNKVELIRELDINELNNIQKNLKVDNNATVVLKK